MGDIRGGVGVSVPMTPYLINQQRQTITVAVSLGLLWLLGFSGLVLANRGLKNRVRERDRAETELQKARDELEKRVRERTADLKKALDDINTLKGIVPICSHCKKIRDDKGYWNQLEANKLIH